jgi:plasmid maintenance system antidote protein VapI
VWSEIAASGRTQQGVAEAVGITPKHLSGMVRGHNGMGLDLVDALLAALGRELVLSTRVRTEAPDE